MKNKSKQNSKWGREQKNKLDQQRREGVLMMMGVFGLILILGFGGFLFNLARRSVWNGSSRLSWVTQDQENISVTTIIPKLSKKVILELPKDLVVAVPFGFGEYRLEKVYSLGELDGKGGKLLTRTLADNLGVVVDGYFVEKESNFSWWDKARLIWFDSFSKRNTKTISHEVLSVRQDELNDGTQILRVSQVLADDLVNQELFDEELANSGVSVAVLNASGVPGVAKNVSRILSNLGTEVSLVGNCPEARDLTQVWVRNEELLKGYVFGELEQMFLISKIETIDIDEYRSDMFLVVGTDYTQL